jgi:serine/threonine-protein kinase
MVTLTLLNNDHQAIKQWYFSQNSIIRIGRVSDNDLVLSKFPQVSRYHLELRKIKNNWKAVNLGQNGAFLNGASFRETLVPNNALIQLAKQGPLLKFSLGTTQNNFCHHEASGPNHIFCLNCGKPLVKEEKFIGNYQLLKFINRGGMGTTYLVCPKNRLIGDNSPPKLFVLKELNSNLVNFNKAHELFMREARILKLLAHPNIPKYYDFFAENDHHYLLMEFVQGQNLQQLIYQQGVASGIQAINWLLEISEIIRYLHSLSPPLVHRDIKPNNLILRTIDQKIFLLDFGAVKEIGTYAGTCIGAEGFAPPEQIIGQPCPQSDLYAMGATLIFLLTGKSPLNYFEVKQKGCAFNLSKIFNLNPHIGNFIQKACQVKINSRHQNIDDFQQHLQQIKTNYY